MMMDTSVTPHAVYSINGVATQLSGGWNTAGAAFMYAGAHHWFIVDKNGKPWSAGINANGQLGDGTTTNQSNFVSCKDSAGNAFPAVGRKVVYVFLQFETTVVVLDDGTVWGCGDLSGGQRAAPGGVYKGSTTTIGFVQLIFPTSPFIRKVVIANGCFALDNTGKIYSWGGSGANMGLGSGSSVIGQPTQVSLPSAADDINVILFDAIVAHLVNGSQYGWGFNMGFLGIGPPGDLGNAQFWYEFPTFGGVNHPVLLDTALNLPYLIAHDSTTGFTKTAANWMGFYVIDTAGGLWYWGDKSNGGGGDGIEANYSLSANGPYAWSQGPGTIWKGNANTSASFNQRKPTHIAPGIRFKSVYTDNNLTPYVYATDVAGNVYAWGRGKSGALGDQVQMCDHILGGQDATYPNALDRPWITQINMTAIFGSTQYNTTCPFCLANPSGSPCNNCVNPPSGTVSTTVSAAPSGNTVILTINATSNKGYYFPRYFLYQVGGAALNIPIQTGQTTTLYNVPNGTYSVKAQAIDQWWDSTSSSVTTFIVSNTSTGSNIFVPYGWNIQFKQN